MTGCAIWADLWANLWAGWGASETIAFLALGAAIWAGVSAHRSAREAKRANQQAMYHERRAVFDAFLDLNMHMQQKGQAPELEKVRAFYRHSHTAAFCFEAALAKEINDYFDAAFWLATHADVTPGLQKLPPDQAKHHRFVQERSLSLLEKVKHAVVAD